MQLLYCRFIWYGETDTCEEDHFIENNDDDIFTARNSEEHLSSICRWFIWINVRKKRCRNNWIKIKY